MGIFLGGLFQIMSLYVLGYMDIPHTSLRYVSVFLEESECWVVAGFSASQHFF